MQKGIMKGRMGFVLIFLICAAIAFMINLLNTVSLFPSGERAQGAYPERTQAEQSDLNERLRIAKEEARRLPTEPFKPWKVMHANRPQKKSSSRV